MNSGVRLVPFDFATEPFDARHPFRRAALARRGVRIAHDGGGGACLQPGLPASGRKPAPQDLTRATLLQQSTRPTGLGRMVRRRRGGGRAIPCAARASSSSPWWPRRRRRPGRRPHPAFPYRGRAGLRPPGDPVSQSLVSGGAYYLVYPEPKAETPLLRSFRDWILDEIRQG